jgi:hypothetical protein
MTESAHILDTRITARVTQYGPKPENLSVSLTCESFGDDGVFYPAKDFRLGSIALSRLRDLLNSLPLE